MGRQGLASRHRLVAHCHGRKLVASILEARTVQAIFEWAVGVDFFVANEALVCIRQRIEAAAATFDRPPGEDDTKRHA